MTGIPYSRVLLGTDFSTHAADAARVATMLAGASAAYRVAWVAPLSLTPGEEAAYRGEIAAWAARAGLPGADARVATGRIANAMAREAVDFRADLVVVGHRGTTGLEKILLGSAARGTLRASPVDTLVARPCAKIERILVATDFEAPSTSAAARASSLAADHGAEVTVAHVVDPTVFYRAIQGTPIGVAPRREWEKGPLKEKLSAFDRAHFGGSATEALLEGRPAVELTRHAAKIGADLLVLASHGGGAVERMLLGSVAESVAELASSSVLIVRE